MSRTKPEILPQKTKLTAGDLSRLLDKFPNLTPVRDQHNLIFYRKEDTDGVGTQMIVLKPSLDKDSGDSCPSLFKVVQDMKNLRQINRKDTLICPLLQQHHYGLELLPIKKSRDQWVALMVCFDQKTQKWVGTLIDPAGFIHANTYGGMRPFALHFSKAFEGLELHAKIDRINLNVQDRFMQDLVESSTWSSGHWVLHCIRLLLQGTKPGSLADAMSKDSLDRVINTNLMSDNTSSVPKEGGVLGYRPAMSVESLRSERPSVDGAVGAEIAANLSIIESQIPFGDDYPGAARATVITEGGNPDSQFRLLGGSVGPDVLLIADADKETVEHKPNRSLNPKKPPSASMCLNCYALLFLGGTVVAIVGVVCLFLAQAMVLPVVSSGLIVAGALGMFAGALGMCAKQSLCCSSTTATPV